MVDWSESGETGAVLIGLAASESLLKITRGRGHIQQSTISMQPADVTIVTAVTKMVVRRRQMMLCSRWHARFQQIRLNASLGNRKSKRVTRSSLPSQQPDSQGNIEGLWLSPLIYGERDSHSGRIRSSPITHLKRERIGRCDRASKRSKEETDEEE